MYDGIQSLSALYVFTFSFIQNWCKNKTGQKKEKPERTCNQSWSQFQTTLYCLFNMNYFKLGRCFGIVAEQDIIVLLCKFSYAINLLRVRACLFFVLVLRRTNTAMVKWWPSSFTGGGRPQLPLRALFQGKAGTWIEPPKFPIS